MYGGPVAVAVFEGVRWYVTPSFVAFHMVPGTVISLVAIYQLLIGATRLSSIAALVGGLTMAFGPGIGPVIGILHFHVGFVLFALVYHLVPGAMVAYVAVSQLRRQSRLQLP